MDLYEGLGFFLLLAALLLPAVVLGLCGVRLKWYGLAVTIAILLVTFRGWQAKACLAAFYSEGGQAGHVAVDVTEARFVKRQRGGRPGMVIYTDQTTVMAEPRREI